MANILLKDTNKNILLSDDVFKVNLNISLLHQVIIAYQKNCRKGNVSQKSRSDVSGSNKKPWRQKGTGRARAGSYKSPIWRSGGVTFATKPKKYFCKVNKKMYNKAFKIILSNLYKESRLYILSNFYVSLPKTKILLDKIKPWGFKKLLIVIKKWDRNLFLSSRNLYNIRICNVNNINIIDFLNFKSVVFTISSIRYLEDKLS